MTTFSSQIHCNQIGSGFFIYPKLWDSSDPGPAFINSHLAVIAEGALRMNCRSLRDVVGACLHVKIRLQTTSYKESWMQW